MFTWPSPGIQIGSCMRRMLGATSVTSGDAGSCSCLGGRVARGCVSVTNGGYRTRSRTCVATPDVVRSDDASSLGLAVRHGGELAPRPVLLRERAAREHELFFVAAGDH